MQKWWTMIRFQVNSLIWQIVTELEMLLYLCQCKKRLATG